MKKIIIIVAAATLIVCSCASAPKEQTFTVDLRSPQVAMGSAEAYFKKDISLGGNNIAQKQMEASYYPVEDAVSLRFKVLLVSCEQFWSKTGRDAFIVAFERYKDDYESRRLITTSNNKTREAYETVDGYFAWKKTPVAVQAQAPARVKLGYQFVGSSPFFTTTQMDAYYEDSISRSRNQTSNVTIMYFTRAQAESLIELFNQDNLRSLIAPSFGSGETDEY
jgi:hypothetical protein